MMADTRRIVFFIVDGFQPLDLFGPLEAFAAANDLSCPRYELQIAGFTAGPALTETGTKVVVDVPIDTIATLDTLVLVGGTGPRQLTLNGAQKAELRRLSTAARRTAAVCTGSFILAQLGLADGCRVTTHWRHAAELAQLHGSLTVDPGAIFTRDGPIWSSAGITAGIDMALAMIAEDAGPAASAGVARQLVVYMRRPGNQMQFSESLLAQSGTTGRLADVIAWIADNLASPIDVESLAARASMSPRQFARVFRKATGASPAQFVERLRVDQARALLAESQVRISDVAAAVGFRNVDTFRRAFERRLAISPSTYRAQFTLDGGKAPSEP